MPSIRTRRTPSGGSRRRALSGTRWSVGGPGARTAAARRRRGRLWSSGPTVTRGSGRRCSSAPSSEL
eukprot:5488547-Pyramimonas_sp.AAC.1